MQGNPEKALFNLTLLWRDSHSAHPKLWHAHTVLPPQLSPSCRGSATQSELTCTQRTPELLPIFPPPRVKLCNFSSRCKNPLFPKQHGEWGLGSFRHQEQHLRVPGSPKYPTAFPQRCMKVPRGSGCSFYRDTFLSPFLNRTITSFLWGVSGWYQDIHDTTLSCTDLHQPPQNLHHGRGSPLPITFSLREPQGSGSPRAPAVGEGVAEATARLTSP